MQLFRDTTLQILYHPSRIQYGILTVNLGDGDGTDGCISTPVGQ